MELLKVLSGGKVLSNSEKRSIPLKDIAKIIKQQLNKEYPQCKFSVRIKNYSVLDIKILETDFKVIMPFEKLSEFAIFEYCSDRYKTKEELKELQEKKYYQVWRINKDEVYNPDECYGGVFLTEWGFNLIKRITELTDKFNYDNSEIQYDYFDVNFYLNLSLGDWNKNKPLIENEPKKI